MSKRVLILGMMILVGVVGFAILTHQRKSKSEIHVRLEPTAAGLAKINHIVFLIKENRSFDNYFGTFPGADGAIWGKTSTGKSVKLGHTLTKLPTT